VGIQLVHQSGNLARYHTTLIVTISERLTFLVESILSLRDVSLPTIDLGDTAELQDTIRYREILDHR